MVDSESIHLSDIDCQSYHDNSYHDNLYETYSTGDQQMHHDCPEEQVQYEPATPQQKPGKEIIYKSSKEMYKAVAKECGITCKMSDQCRCYDCQSRYFDCEYEQVRLFRRNIFRGEGVYKGMKESIMIKQWWWNERKNLI